VPGISTRRSDRQWDDLFQEGCLGLIRAAVLFRPERGIPFAAFAFPRIHTAVRRLLLARCDSAVRSQVAGDRAEDEESPWSRNDPRRRSRMRNRTPDAERSLPDRRRRASQEDCRRATIGDRLREKYERAVRRASEEVLSRASIRGDRDQLVRLLVEGRFLVPHDDEKKSYRSIAGETRSSYARVAQCDRNLSDGIRRTLSVDPEFVELKRVARSDPRGTETPVDVGFDQYLARLGAMGFVDRFRQADAARRAVCLGQLLEAGGDAVERLIASEVERLPESARERLYDASAPNPNRTDQRRAESDGDGRASNRRKGAIRHTVLGPMPETVSRSPGDRNARDESSANPDRDSR